MIIINGETEYRIKISDRGLQYGDGIFETIAYRNNEAEFIDAHLERLSFACKRLKLPFNNGELLQELNNVLTELSGKDAVIKIIITRGEGGRGYLADPTIEPTRIISTHSLPNYPDSYYDKGISIRYCDHRLSENRTLSGLKHLNRLDQVMARNEWSDPNIAEGLMLDQNDYLIEGTMSNLFIVKSAQLITPRLTTSGVFGIMRAELIKLAKHLNITCKEAQITKQDLETADEVFVCNSVNGIWPVNNNTDTGTQYARGAITRHLQHALSGMTQ